VCDDDTVGGTHKEKKKIIFTAVEIGNVSVFIILELQIIFQKGM
jgi:hypothetical protein